MIDIVAKQPSDIKKQRANTFTIKLNLIQLELELNQG